MRANKELVEFIKKARERGFDDLQIKNPLLERGWQIDEIEKAFSVLKPRYKFKNKITVFLDSDVLKVLEKRAKKNMFTVSEQIDDILRRSVISSKRGYPKPIKIDDSLINIFSREKRGRK